MAKKNNNKYPVLNGLKGRMRELGITYRELGNIMGIAPNTLCQKINGYSIFGANEIVKIVNSLHIEPKDIAKYFFPELFKIHRKR